ncbi:MAG TPA: hypothetical protein VFN09_10210, partial [Rhodanobacteraceae bacterium]|nr:hypothetical protein [Rhodanobacteraceae bacterium]
DEFALSTDLIDGDGCSLTGLVALSRAAVVPVCLARSVAATNRLSPEANRRYALWKTASLVPRALRRLAVRGRLPSGPVCATASEPAVVPSSMTVLRFLPRLLARRLIARHHRQHNVEHWQLAWRRAEAPLDPAAPSQRGMRPLQTPHGHFWADPFLFHDHGRYWLFFEDLPYASGIGRIGCVEMAQTGPVGAARTVLELDSHLSYPQLFRWQGGIYLMPENGDANRVRVYRALEFPWRWEPAADILTGHNFSDATLWQHEDGRWYLFANVSESGGSVHDELFLFHADNPFGPWWPHAENPIVSDVRRARAAGPLFRHEGRLIRPAQDCAWNYGRAINFHVIDELSLTRYVERPLSRLRGYWSKDLHGCHTYTRADRLEAMDGKAFRSRRAVGASAMREPD